MKKEYEPEFKGFVDFDDSIGVSSAPSPQTPLPCFLSRVSVPLFRIFFLYMILVFVGYAVYFLFVMLSPFYPQFFSGIQNSLPAPISEIISLFTVYHIAAAVFLAFLNFAVSFADIHLSGKSLKTRLFSLLSPAIKPVLWMAGIFLIAALIGYIFGSFYPEVFESLVNFSDLPDGGSVSMTLFIFFNNTRIVFMMMFLGFIFGFLPVAIVFINGFTVGIVAEYMVKNEGLLFLSAGLLPHGVVEIPIILLGAGFGFYSGVLASGTFFKRDSFDVFKQRFVGETWIFFLIAVPLLFIAAVIEVYVTSPLLGIVSP